MMPISSPCHGRARTIKAYRTFSNLVPSTLTVHPSPTYRFFPFMTSKWMAPSLMEYNRHNTFCILGLPKIGDINYCVEIQCATAASLVSSLDVRKKGISVVPPVPTNSCVCGFFVASVVEADAMSLRLTALAGLPMRLGIMIYLVTKAMCLSRNALRAATAVLKAARSSTWS